jgi:hypothetical protein
MESWKLSAFACVKAIDEDSGIKRPANNNIYTTMVNLRNKLRQIFTGYQVIRIGWKNNQNGQIRTAYRKFYKISNRCSNSRKFQKIISHLYFSGCADNQEIPSEA